MEKYSQNLTTKIFPITAGRMVCVLNEVDAREFGLFVGDRVELKYKKKSCVAVTDFTKDYVKENHIGLFKDVSELLGVKGKEQVNVSPTGRIKSVDFIRKKMLGEKLSYDEIKMIVKDIAEDRLSEIETTAFVSSVFMRGLDLDETTSMTKALIENGNRIKFNSKKPIVDKHSVGGVNGRATMVVVPIVAAAGLLIPKTSSRSITSAAGTADSMEVIARVDLSMSEVKTLTEKVGGVLSWGGAVDLAPADDKIIKIEHPLSLDPEGQVIASVLAKKASVGSKYVVIDLPVGKYVKIKDKEIALRMAKKFVQVGKEVGMEVEAVITDGEEPSGLAFGPALETKYALEVLEGKRFDNLAQKSCELSGVLFEMVGLAKTNKGYDMAVDILKSGRAYEKMKEIIKAQKGKIFSSEQIPMPKLKVNIISKEDGVVEEINTKELTKIARMAGCPANKYAGIMMNKIVGDKITKGEILYTIYAEQKNKLEVAEEYAKENNPYKLKKIILHTIRSKKEWNCVIKFLIKSWWKIMENSVKLILIIVLLIFGLIVLITGISVLFVMLPIMLNVSNDSVGNDSVNTISNSLSIFKNGGRGVSPIFSINKGEIISSYAFVKKGFDSHSIIFAVHPTLENDFFVDSTFYQSSIKVLNSAPNRVRAEIFCAIDGSSLKTLVDSENVEYYSNEELPSICGENEYTPCCLVVIRKV